MKTELTLTDCKLISKIANRAMKMFDGSQEKQTELIRTCSEYSGYNNKKMDFMIDLEKVNCDLDLQALLDADDLNFAHDIAGINRHLDHDTGELKDCFWPRFAR